MTGAPRRAQAAYGLALVVVAIDQWLKHWLLAGLRLQPGASLAVYGPLRLTLVANNGISYGLLQGQSPWMRWVLVAFSLAVAIGLAVWARRAERPLTALAIGLIMGGAVGNMIDRVARGAVVDFLDLTALRFPWVFNIADSAITVGILLLLAESLFSSSPSARV